MILQSFVSIYIAVNCKMAVSPAFQCAIDLCVAISVPHQASQSYRVLQAYTPKHKSTEV